MAVPNTVRSQELTRSGGGPNSKETWSGIGVTMPHSAQRGGESCACGGMRILRKPRVGSAWQFVIRALPYDRARGKCFVRGNMICAEAHALFIDVGLVRG